MQNKKSNSPSLFHGFKNSEIVFTDLPGYKDYMIELEFDAGVVSYFQPQMDLIIERPERRPHLLKVDFWLIRRSGACEFIHLHDEEIDAEILPEAIGYARSVDSTFKPLRVSDVHKEPRRSNLALLWKHARRELKNIHLAYLSKFFRAEPYPTIDALRAFLQTNGLAADLAYAFLFKQYLIADIDNFPLTGDTGIVHNGGLRLPDNDPPERQFSFLEIWKGYDPDEVEEIF